MSVRNSRPENSNKEHHLKKSGYHEEEYCCCVGNCIEEGGSTCPAEINSGRVEVLTGIDIR
jgi:hypothetical protein